MGREIRRVPPNHEHPRRQCEHSPWAGGCKESKEHGGMCYQPQFNERIDDALGTWLVDLDRVRAGKWQKIERECYPTERGRPHIRLAAWIKDNPPPDPDYYRAYKDAAATWWQVYETVSEGSPVTPPFETREELIDYLATHGDFWDQHRGDGPWQRDSAQRFVRGDGWRLSMIADGSGLKLARDQ